MSSSIPVTVTTDFPVRYAETDAMGVVHHATYLVYFEEGRSHYMRTMGSDYAELEARGFQLPVTGVSIRYAGSLRYGERARISSRIEQNKSRRISFSYQVTNAVNDRVLVTGTTHHIWTAADGKATRAPDRWHTLYKKFIER